MSASHIPNAGQIGTPNTKDSARLLERFQDGATFTFLDWSRVRPLIGKRVGMQIQTSGNGSVQVLSVGVESSG